MTPSATKARSGGYAARCSRQPVWSSWSRPAWARSPIRSATPLELTALGEPLAQPALDQLAETEAIAALEDRGLLSSRMDGRRLQVCLAHPVYGEVVRSGISPRRPARVGPGACRGVG